MTDRCHVDHGWWTSVHLAALVAASVIIAACGATAEDATGTSGATTTSGETPTSSASTVTSTTLESTTTTLAGIPFEFGPPAGAVLAVMGVFYEDVLNIRVGPRFDQEIVATLDPLADHVVATGRAQMLPTSAFWYEVTVNGITGWVNASFLAYVANTEDVTSRVVDLLGEVPTAGNMVELGEIVAQALASNDSEVPSTITLIAVSTLDPTEVIYDVVGLADDSVAGVRVHVFGNQIDAGFSLSRVEETALCDSTRSVTPAGFCA